MRKPKAKVGDWVRIMRGGSLVLAEVRYVVDDGWEPRYTLDHHGSAVNEDLLEVRPAPPSAQPDCEREK